MAKGKSFEIEVRNLLTQSIRHGDLPFDPRLVKIFHRKGYYSRDRQKDIVTDVSVELFRQSAPTYFFVWIWECKDYTSSVPVDDLEEFHSKLEQIGADRTKGTVVTRVGFESGAIEYARSKGIGLARVIQHRRLAHVLETSNDISRMQLVTATLLAGRPPLGLEFGALTTDGQPQFLLTHLVSAELRHAIGPDALT